MARLSLSLSLSVHPGVPVLRICMRPRCGVAQWSVLGTAVPPGQHQASPLNRGPALSRIAVAKVVPRFARRAAEGSINRHPNRGCAFPRAAVAKCAATSDNAVGGCADEDPR